MPKEDVLCILKNILVNHTFFCDENNVFLTLHGAQIIPVEGREAKLGAPLALIFLVQRGCIFIDYYV